MGSQKTGSKKVIVSNRSALQMKYGDFTEEIERALDFIIGMDSTRGISSCLVMLDDEDKMRRCRAAPVTDPGSREQNKKAIDAAARYYRPDYLTLFGGPDVIPYQELKDPDGGESILTDLPYACEHAYGTTLAHFLKPKRMTARIPDICGREDQETLKNGGTASGLIFMMLTGISQIREADRETYEDCFAAVADDWKKGQEEELQLLFGDKEHVKYSVPEEKLSEQAAYYRVHCLALHGAERDPWLYYDPALKRKAIGFYHPTDGEALSYKEEQWIRPGSLVLNRSPYGAKLEDCGGYLPLPVIYFINKAAAYLGTVGKESFNRYDALFFRVYMEELRNGQTVGGAYINAAGAVGEAAKDQAEARKAMARWVAMGDSSVRPVRGPA